MIALRSTMMVLVCEGEGEVVVADSSQNYLVCI